MKDLSKINQGLIAENSALKKRIQELEQTLSEKIWEENERRSRQLTMLHETSVELTAELNLDALLHSIVHRALNLIGGAACNCYIYNPQTDLLERVASAGTALVPSPNKRKRGEGMVGQVWVKGMPLLINDYASWSGRTRTYDSFPSRALVGAPLRLGTEILGVLNIMAPLPHQYTQMDVEMLSLFAAQAAIALRNAQIHDRINKELAERKQAEETAARVAREWQLTFDATNDAIWILDKDHRVLQSNKTAERFFHRPFGEMIGKHCWEIVHGTAQPIPECPMLRVRKSLQRETMELYVSERWFEVIVDPILDAAGRYSGAFHIISDITERKKAEDALKEIERVKSELLEKMNEAQHIAMIGSWEWDLKTNYVWWSDETYRIFGVTPQDFVPSFEANGKFIHPDDFARYGKSFEHSLQTGEPLDYDFRLVANDGLLKYCHAGGRSIYDDSGQPIRFIGTIMDISARKLAEDDLKRSEKKHRLLHESMMDGFVSVGMDGKILEFNEIYRNMLGYSETELATLTYVDLTPEKWHAYEADIVENQILKRGYSDVYEKEYRRKDGTTFPVELHTVLNLDEHGKPAKMWAITRDITDRKRAEEALQASKAQLSNALEIAHLGHWEYDVANDLFTFNDQFYKIFQTTVGQVGGYTMHSAEYAHRFIHPDDIDVVGEETRKAIETTDPHFNRQIEHRMLYADGTVGYITVRFFVIKDSHGRTVKTYGVNQDITERKEAEKQLQDTLESLRKAVNTTVQVMVSAVETRDPYTAGHQIRSADLARSIATEMGLPQDKIEGIRMAGPIHDIGKLSIPAEILSKPTKLTNIEFSLIKEHSRQGYEILKDVESPWPLAEIIYQHHERMDGSGYPRNLKGDEILMESRIIAVADVVESMASHRPYRPGLGIDAALEEISKNRGTLYDPEVSDACMKLFHEKGYRFSELA